MKSLPNGNRGPIFFEAYLVLINAAYGGGEVDEARELVAWALETQYRGENANWWVSVSNGCDDTRSCDCELNLLIGVRMDSPFGVQSLDSHEREILAVGHDGGAIRG